MEPKHGRGKRVRECQGKAKKGKGKRIFDETCGEKSHWMTCILITFRPRRGIKRRHHLTSDFAFKPPEPDLFGNGQPHVAVAVGGQVVRKTMVE